MNLQLECPEVRWATRAVVSTTHRTTWAAARKSSKAFFQKFQSISSLHVSHLE